MIKAIKAMAFIYLVVIATMAGYSAGLTTGHNKANNGEGYCEGDKYLYRGVCYSFYDEIERGN